LIANGQNASFGTAPWNVAIYRLNGKKHKLKCGGSIIGPNLVISGKIPLKRIYERMKFKLI